MPCFAASEGGSLSLLRTPLKLMRNLGSTLRRPIGPTSSVSSGGCPHSASAWLASGRALPLPISRHVCMRFVPSNGRTSASISNSSTPTAQMSAGLPYACPVTSSGARYAGVPAAVPATRDPAPPMRAVVRTSSFFESPRSPMRRTSCASEAKKMLAEDRSRWSTLCECMYATALAICTREPTTHSLSNPPPSSRCSWMAFARVSPAAYSKVMQSERM
mmetsp:Transcript_43274/g.113708  ORF Transcript_43274/g.113708 Transcript_43274/m.113708 type:complete len:218 (+) Transcript_43274:165-818(+)